MRFTVADLLELDGTLLVVGSPDDTFDGATQDSRAVTGGELFVPVADVRDGHDFIDDALAAGCAGYLTNGPRSGADSAFCVEVADPAGTLVSLGGRARRRLDDVLAITGSAGKTTTKDFLGAVLRRDAPTGVAAGSFNNEIGIPLTLVCTPDDARRCVVEIGARHVGDVAAGCKIVEPTVGIVTNVGMAHIGIFGSREAIAIAKGELVEALPESGTAVLNADDELVMAMTERTQAAVVTFGSGPDADVYAESLEIGDGLTAEFKLIVPDGSADVRLDGAGVHIVECALAAAAAAQLRGIGAGEIAAGLEAAPRSAHRMKVEASPGGWTVVDDSYNANPASMRAALETSALLAGATGRRLALLGTMAELGDFAPDAHREVGDLARGLGFMVVGVGEHSDHLAGEVAFDAGSGAKRLRELAGEFAPGDVILVKASRAVGLDAAVPLLISEEF